MQPVDEDHPQEGETPPAMALAGHVDNPDLAPQAPPELPVSGRSYSAATESSLDNYAFNDEQRLDA